MCFKVLASRKTSIAIALLILTIAAIWYAWKISTFSSLSESEAKWWVHTSELVLIGSAVLLTIGLFGEWSDSESWKKRLLYKVSKAAVIIGVVGELLADGGIFEAGDRVQELQGKEIVISRLDAMKANIRAVSGQLALAKVLAPRNLSDDAIKRIIEKLKPLGPQPFTYSVTLAMEEGSDLPRQLGILLIKDCGWQMYEQPQGRVLYRGMKGIGAAFGAGVIVAYDEKTATLKKAAETLVEALGDESIASRVEPADPNNPADNPAAIEIAIGTKPIFLREVEDLLLQGVAPPKTKD